MTPVTCGRTSETWKAATRPGSCCSIGALPCWTTTTSLTGWLASWWAWGQLLALGEVALGAGGEAAAELAAMASGGMDTLPHNGAVITLLR